MVSLLLHPSRDRRDLLIAELQECGTTGISEEDGGLRAFFLSDRLSARNGVSLLDLFAEFSPEIREEPSIDWERVARAAWPPLCVGERFYLVAPWDHAAPTPPGRLRLEIYPGMACGTGRHPATQLCLQAMERTVRPGARVLDVGSGSGILAAAAGLLEAGSIIACDIDHDVVLVARERVHVPMFAGSADGVRAQWADVIVANLDGAALERIAGELERVRRPGSTLILSGFPEGDVPEGFSPKEILSLEEWRCFVC